MKAQKLWHAVWPRFSTRFDKAAIVCDFISVGLATLLAIVAVKSPTSEYRVTLPILIVVFQVASRIAKNVSIKLVHKREEQHLLDFVRVQSSLVGELVEFASGREKNPRRFQRRLLESLVACLDSKRVYGMRASIYGRASKESRTLSDSSEYTEFRLLEHSHLEGGAPNPRELFSTDHEPGATFIPLILREGRYPADGVDISKSYDPLYSNGRQRPYGSFWSLSIEKQFQGEGQAVDQRSDGVDFILTCDAAPKGFFTFDAQTVIRAFGDMASHVYSAADGGDDEPHRPKLGQESVMEGGELDGK